MKRSALTASQSAALAQAAATLGISSDWLFAAINHESGFKPTIKNPNSSAQGLLQWIDSTSQDLGYDSTADLIAQNPTVEQQLTGPVVAYLSKYKPFPTIEDLAGAIFYPANRGAKIDTPLPAAVQKANPGIVTLRDYANKYLLPKAAAGAGVVVVLLSLGAAAWWWSSRH